MANLFHREPTIRILRRCREGSAALQKLPRTQQTLAKRIKTLRTLLNQSVSKYHLFKLRDAKIQVLKARIGEMPIPTLLTPLEEQRIAKLSRQIEMLSATTPSEILAKYRWKSSQAGEEP